MTAAAIRTETHGRIRTIVFARAAEYNTITPQWRDEFSAALDEAERDHGIHVVVLRADGQAFCAGYGLDWSTAAQASAEERSRAWDSVADLHMIGRYVRVFRKMWDLSKPVIAAVHGWCIAGGTDMVLCADMIIAGDSAKFGYPPSRVWGVPTSAMWVYRMGFERAKRYLLTGDEIGAREAEKIGLILECVPDSELEARAMALAERMALVPLNQLSMLKMLCNEPAEHMGLRSSQLLGSFFDGVARHSQEGRDFVTRAQEVGFRQAVRERDAPFGDYGERKNK